MDRENQSDKETYAMKGGISKKVERVNVCTVV